MNVCLCLELYMLLVKFRRTMLYYYHYYGYCYYSFGCCSVFKCLFRAILYQHSILWLCWSGDVKGFQRVRSPDLTWQPFWLGVTYTVSHKNTHTVFLWCLWQMRSCFITFSFWLTVYEDGPIKQNDGHGGGCDVNIIIIHAQVRSADGQSDAETRSMLQGIVRHFQTLFDVPNVLGVYARMSAIYRNLSETHTVLTTLKDHLDLGKNSQNSVMICLQWRSWLILSCWILHSKEWLCIGWQYGMAWTSAVPTTTLQAAVVPKIKPQLLCLNSTFLHPQHSCGKLMALKLFCKCFGKVLIYM